MRFTTVLRATLVALALALVAAAVAVATADPAHAAAAGRRALTSPTDGLGYYTHFLSTVIDRYPDTDPHSPDRTPIVCEEQRLMVGTGVYSFGTTFANDGNSYDQDNIFVHGGIYVWSDCLFPSAHGGYLQLARLHPAWLPDDGTHDTAVITHARTGPLPIDTDENGRTWWGSFLDQTE